MVAVATAAPVPGKPPTISGTPAYQQTLTCNRGHVVSRRRLLLLRMGDLRRLDDRRRAAAEVPASAIGFDVVCIVTARDAQGQTTPASSAQVLIAPGISTVKITKASAAHGIVTISGIVGPAVARKHGPNGWSTVVLDRIIAGQSEQQISNPKIIRTRNGAFTVSGHDVKGRHTYVVNYEPSEGSGYAPGTTTRKLTVR